ncbi:DUF3829 domain-containing protein [Aquimarina algicola]|uniref:DUF3829 domain-containing protein n=1 Tax=Aquimarina algicola TaxID=2589995 RepID=A0A504JLN7_9FLAO|nr:DUF3829 domain-containing protein [Aquimarina algicola]TPN89305.1 DUF3829 domain-containing protein [Aquimarina algicola]
MNNITRIVLASLLCFVSFTFGFQKPQKKPLVRGEDPVAHTVFDNVHSYRASINSNLETVTNAYQSYINQIDTISGLPKVKKRIRLSALLSAYDDIPNVKEVFTKEPNVYVPVKEASIQYIQCLTELKILYSSTLRYYFRESYKNDDYKEAKKMNPQLMSAFYGFFQAQYDLKKEIIAIGKEKGYYLKDHKVTKMSSIPSVAYQIKLEGCDKGKEMAEHSFKQKEYKIISYGLPSFDADDSYETYKTKMKQKYGIRFVEIGCIVSGYHLCYNERMRELLNQKFKKDIFDTDK